MDADMLANARAVVARLAKAEGEATPGPWEWQDGHVVYGARIGGSTASREVDVATALALRNAAPALIWLAEAVGRLVEGDPAWAWSEVGMVFACQVCGSQTGTHAPDCPALAIDRALADLAALDGGDHDD